METVKIGYARCSTLSQDLEAQRKALRGVHENRIYADHGLTGTNRESLGLAPGEWLQRERMYRARELLEPSDSSLDDIADECGYRSLEAFCAAFKRIVGTSHSADRKRFRCVK